MVVVVVVTYCICLTNQGWRWNISLMSVWPARFRDLSLGQVMKRFLGLLFYIGHVMSCLVVLCCCTSNRDCPRIFCFLVGFVKLFSDQLVFFVYFS